MAKKKSDDRGDILRSEIKELLKIVRRVEKMTDADMTIDDLLKVMRGVGEADNRIASMIRTLEYIEATTGPFDISQEYQKALSEVWVELKKRGAKWEDD